MILYIHKNKRKLEGIKMLIFDISNPLTLLLMLAVTVLLIFLAQEVKKSMIVAGVLFVYLVLLITHVAQIATLSEEYRYMLEILSRCIVIDFIFVFISFFSYLWVDDIETKKLGKKSLDDSLDWFWKKV
jgi:threonine/homoserine/homoserine lactone efflux protein